MRFCWNRSSAASRSAATPSWARGLICGCGRADGRSRLSADASGETAAGKRFSGGEAAAERASARSGAGLPPFTAGAVGYFSYDVVRQLEKIGDHAKDDLSLPDCELMFFDRLLAFDHLRHQIHIVAAADVSRENPRRAYDRAVRDIAALEQQAGGGTASGDVAQIRRRPSRANSRSMPEQPARHFLRSVERCKEYIAAGDIFQVVLSQRLDFIPGVQPVRPLPRAAAGESFALSLFPAHGRDADPGVVS